MRRLVALRFVLLAAGLVVLRLRRRRRRFRLPWLQFARLRWVGELVVD